MMLDCAYVPSAFLLVIQLRNEFHRLKKYLDIIFAIFISRKQNLIFPR